jgi:protoporphyrinogen oxidase
VINQENKQIIILGAGASGLTAAHYLASQGNHVLVLDTYRDAGGNHKSLNINEYTFDIGSFVFWGNTQFSRIFPEFIAHAVPVDASANRIAPDCRIKAYPFDARKEIYGQHPVEIAKCFSSMTVNRITIWQQRNLRDFLKRRLGSYIYERSGLRFYVERFCGLPDDRVDIRFAKERMQWVIQKTSILFHARRVLRNVADQFAQKKIEMPRATALVRPAAGFHTMYAPVLERLRAVGVDVRLGVDIKAISHTSDGFIVETCNDRFLACKVISSIPIGATASLLGLRSDDAPESIALTTLFVSFHGERAFKKAILFNFHSDGNWKRLTMHSDFYGIRNEREYFSVEINGDKTEVVQSEFAHFCNHVRRVGVLSGDFKLEGSALTENAYPLYTPENLFRSERLISKIEHLGVQMVGRQGRFQYLPTNASAAQAVLRVLSRGTHFRND